MSIATTGARSGGDDPILAIKREAEVGSARSRRRHARANIVGAQTVALFNDGQNRPVALLELGVQAAPITRQRR